MHLVYYIILYNNILNMASILNFIGTYSYASIPIITCNILFYSPEQNGKKPFPFHTYI
jgi:hypothetical protein